MADNEVGGAHVYVLAPLAVNVVVMPVVMATAVGLTVTVGNGLIVAVTGFVTEQPVAVVPLI